MSVDKENGLFLFSVLSLERENIFVDLLSLLSSVYENKPVDLVLFLLSSFLFKKSNPVDFLSFLSPNRLKPVAVFLSSESPKVNPVFFSLFVPNNPKPVV